jgi:acetyl esterase/lipase
MKLPHRLLSLLLLVITVFNVNAQEKPYDELEGADIKVYKTVDDYDLKMNILYPKDYKKGKKYPAIIFFFGGGWQNGDVHQFEHQCRFIASKGMIAMAANYRVASRNHSTPVDAVEDAKSAMRWVRQHARELGVKKNKIVAAGGSAGGHLAASAALINGLDAKGEKAKISAVPNALVLFNPVINTTPEGFGSERLGDMAEIVSPAHHVSRKVPPTLIFHGTADNTVPFENIADFQEKMWASGNTCYVVPFTDQGHGFFNYGRHENIYYELTVEKMEAFLRGLKYIRQSNY